MPPSAAPPGAAQGETEEAGTGAAPLDAQADTPDDPGTPYRLAPHQPFSGILGPAVPRDRVAVTLQAGMTYDFAMLGSPSGAGTLRDPYGSTIPTAG